METVNCENCVHGFEDNNFIFCCIFGKIKRKNNTCKYGKEY